MFKKILTQLKIKPYQALFSSLAICMAVIVGIFIIYATFFLVDNFNQALDVKIAPKSTTARFDIKGFEKLHLNVLR